jgi:hypothetical protein
MHRLRARPLFLLHALSARLSFGALLPVRPGFFGTLPAPTNVAELGVASSGAGGGL